MAWYPTSHGMSRPTESRTTSTPDDAIWTRVRARRSRNVAVIDEAEQVSTADDTIECPLTSPTLTDEFRPLCSADDTQR